MPFLTHHQEFRERHQSTAQGFVFDGTGTVELQAKAGDADDSADWVPVPTDFVTRETEVQAPACPTIRVSTEQIYRFSITGDVTIWFADPETELLS